MDDLKGPIAILLSMMTVLRYAPGVDDGTVKTYVWAMSDVRPSPDEIKQATRRIMTTRTEWQTPCDVIACIKAIRREAPVQVTDVKPIGEGVDTFIGRDVRDAILVGRFGQDLLEEIDAKRREVHE